MSEEVCHKKVVIFCDGFPYRQIEHFRNIGFLLNVKAKFRASSSTARYLQCSMVISCHKMEDQVYAIEKVVI